MIYLFLKLCAIFVFNILYKVKVKGLENIPKEGRLVLAPRHCSYFDPMVLFHVSPRRFHGVVAKQIYTLWWLNWVFRATSCIPTNGSSIGVVATLEKDEVILIFPEGGREPEGHLIKARRGAAVFALKTGAPVIPIWIKGTYEAWSEKRKNPRLFCNLEVRFGKALTFAKRDEELIPAPIINETLEKIMQAIANLSGKQENCLRK